MSRAPATFRQRDVNAAIRAVERAGKGVSEVVFSPDGSIRIVVRRAGEAEQEKLEMV